MKVTTVTDMWPIIKRLIPNIPDNVTRFVLTGDPRDGVMRVDIEYLPDIGKELIEESFNLVPVVTELEDSSAGR